MAEAETGGVKIKKEARDLLQSLSESSAANPWPPRQPNRTGAQTSGQQKITQFFTNNKSCAQQQQNANAKQESEENGRKSPALDVESVKGRFGWTTLGTVHIPFILRKEERFAAVRIIEGKLLKKFLRVLPSDVYSCTYIKSYFITENEAKLLNEINAQHCEYQFGYEQFTPKDLVVPLGDARQFYEFLETCYCRLVDPNSHSSASRCGFIKFNGAVMPYVTRDGSKYVPLAFIEQELQALKMNAEKLESWELSYLKFCCKVAGISGEVLTDNCCPVVRLDSLQQHSDARMYFEDWWPAKKETSMDMDLSIYQKKAGMGLMDHSPTLGIPKSIFQVPTAAASPNKLLSPAKVGNPGAGGNAKPSDAIPKDKSSQQQMAKSQAEKLAAVSTPSPVTSYPTTGTLPSMGAVPWSSPQSFIFNSQWWGPMTSHLIPTFSTSAKSTDMFLPTLIPSPNFSLEKLIQQHVQTTAATSYPSSHKDKTTPISPNNSAKGSRKDETPTKVVPHPPPPLVKSGVHSADPALSFANGTRMPGSAISVPTTMPSCNDLSNKSNNQPISKEGHTMADRHVSMNHQRIATELSHQTCRSSQVESRVVVPGILQSAVKQTSPKPANPVPSVGGSALNPFISRPPPPLVSVAGSGMTPATTSSSMTRHAATMSNQHSKSTHQEEPYNSFPPSIASTSALQSSSSNILNRPFVIPEPTYTQATDGRRPYKLQLLAIDGRQLPVMNGQPYIYGSPYLAAVKDVVAHLFPTTTCHCFQQVLSDVLGIKLYSSNRLQQEAYRNQSNCYAIEEKSSFVLIQVEDLNNYMPHLKYMFSRLESSRSDLHPSYVGESVAGYSHTPKRIRL